MCINGRADAGDTFQYIYDNRASGKSTLGMVCDRILLSKSGAKASRARKETLKVVIQNHLINTKENIDIVDLACGLSPYLLEIVPILERAGVSLLCIDRDKEVLARANAHFHNSGLQNARFLASEIEPGIVEQLLKMRSPMRSFLVILSGHMEYLSDQALGELLNKLYDCFASNDKLLITNQCMNPSRWLMETFGRTTYGLPWKLNYRSASTAREFFESAGFAISEFREDVWGIYHVILAQKH